ncbi:MAG TPA: hypothetical protein VGG10_02945 [Rhizomicrobium sp.]|jgi:hypothetical protein
MLGSISVGDNADRCNEDGTGKVQGADLRVSATDRGAFDVTKIIPDLETIICARLAW